MHLESALFVVVRQTELDVAGDRKLAETGIARVAVDAGNALFARLRTTHVPTVFQFTFYLLLRTKSSSRVLLMKHRLAVVIVR